MPKKTRNRSTSVLRNVLGDVPANVSSLDFDPKSGAFKATFWPPMAVSGTLPGIGPAPAMPGWKPDKPDIADFVFDEPADTIAPEEDQETPVSMDVQGEALESAPEASA